MDVKLHDNLKKYRLHKQFTQEQVAQQIGVSQQAYGHYETGRREPNIETLILLANLYNTSIDILVGRYEQKL